MIWKRVQSTSKLFIINLRTNNWYESSPINHDVDSTLFSSPCYDLFDIHNNDLGNSTITNSSIYNNSISADYLVNQVSLKRVYMFTSYKTLDNKNSDYDYTYLLYLLYLLLLLSLLLIWVNVESTFSQ